MAGSWLQRPGWRHLENHGINLPNCSAAAPLPIPRVWERHVHRGCGARGPRGGALDADHRAPVAPGHPVTRKAELPLLSGRIDLSLLTLGCTVTSIISWRCPARGAGHTGSPGQAWWVATGQAGDLDFTLLVPNLCSMSFKGGAGGRKVARAPSLDPHSHTLTHACGHLGLAQTCTCTRAPGWGPAQTAVLLACLAPTLSEGPSL